MKTASFAVLLVGIVTQLASAGLQLDISGVPGSGQVTLDFSSSTQANLTMSGTMSKDLFYEWRNFDVEFFDGFASDPWALTGFASGFASTDPGVTPTDTSIINPNNLNPNPDLTVVSNTVQLSFSDGVTTTSTGIDLLYVDDDMPPVSPPDFTDIGFSSVDTISYTDMDFINVSGSIVLGGLDIGRFVAGGPYVSSSSTLSGLAPLSVNVSAVPEPSSWILLSLITGLVVTRNGVKRLFARWFSK